MLNDAHTYEKLQADPTSSYERKLIEKLTKLNKDSKITEDQHKYLYPTSKPHPDCTAHQKSTRLTAF